jgi:hypothetical protein
MTDIPEPIRRAVQHEEWTEQALERAARPLGGAEQFQQAEPGTVAAFVANMAAQRQREEQRAARVNRLMHENPEVRPDDEPDPLRALYEQRRAGRRRRGRVRFWE